MPHAELKMSPNDPDYDDLAWKTRDPRNRSPEEADQARREAQREAAAIKETLFNTEVWGEKNGAAKYKISSPESAKRLLQNLRIQIKLLRDSAEKTGENLYVQWSRNQKTNPTAEITISADAANLETALETFIKLAEPATTALKSSADQPDPYRTTPFTPEQIEEAGLRSAAMTPTEIIEREVPKTEQAHDEK